MNSRKYGENTRSSSTTITRPKRFTTSVTPAITEFAQMYQVSAKTIKKALDNLADEGYITFVRGRYGGTFVMDIPQVNEAYKWLALNPAYTSGMEN